MATGRVNIGGGGAGINVYTQPTEPFKKEGIWIKTNSGKSEVVSDDSLWFSGVWANPSQKSYAPIPYKSARKSVCKKGTDVYVGLGYNGSLYTKEFYKYDSINDVWTRLADYPESNAQVDSGSVGFSAYKNYIYAFASTGRSYRYDIETNMWTQITFNKTFKRCTVCTVGDYIYLFATSNTSPYYTTPYKYDPNTDTFVTLPYQPVGSNNYAQALVYGSSIFLVGGGGAESTVTGNLLRKLDTLTDLWSTEKLASCPYAGAYAYTDDNKIYNHITFGSNTIKHFVYDIINNVWTEDSTSYFPMNVGREWNFINIGPYVVALDNSNTTDVYRYNKTSKSYNEGSVVVYRINPAYGVYRTELASLPKGLFNGTNNRLLTAFDDVYMVIDGDLKPNLETYYGDGAKWVQFKGF